MQKHRMIVALALAAAAAVSAMAQAALVTEDQARAWAVTAAASAKGEERAFSRAFRDLVRTSVTGYDSETVTAYYSEGLTIALRGPLSAFHGAAETAVRKMEKLESVPWSKGPMIIVYPSRIDAENIEKVVVTRDGAIVEPIENTLTQTELETRMGAKVKIGAGVVTYPPDTFLPGAEVIITAIPVNGANLTKKLSPNDLKKIR